VIVIYMQPIWFLSADSATTILLLIHSLKVILCHAVEAPKMFISAFGQVK
jgi:hypothetical protein